MMFPKNKRIRDKKYLGYVRSFPCCVCNIKDDTIAPHHIWYRAKCPDYKTVPLCYNHHKGDKGVHDGKETFHEYHGLDLEKIADEIYRGWER